MVRTKTFSKARNHVFVQNAKDFVEIAKKYLGKTVVIFISEEQIHHYISVHKPFEGTVCVPGIINMHVIESSGICICKLWRNARYNINTSVFTVPVTTREVAGPVRSSDFYEFGDWIIVRYLFYII